MMALKAPAGGRFFQIQLFGASMRSRGLIFQTKFYSNWIFHVFLFFEGISTKVKLANFTIGS
jgi:hypothetical protein